MKPYSPQSNKGRTVSGDDVHHKTADQSKQAANAAAKSLRKAARQEGARQARGEYPGKGDCDKGNGSQGSGVIS